MTSSLPGSYARPSRLTSSSVRCGILPSAGARASIGYAVGVKLRKFWRFRHLACKTLFLFFISRCLFYFCQIWTENGGRVSRLVMEVVWSWWTLAFDLVAFYSPRVSDDDLLLPLAVEQWVGWQLGSMKSATIIPSPGILCWCVFVFYARVQFYSLCIKCAYSRVSKDPWLKRCTLDEDKKCNVSVFFRSPVWSLSLAYIFCQDRLVGYLSGSLIEKISCVFVIVLISPRRPTEKRVRWRYYRYISGLTQQRKVFSLIMIYFMLKRSCTPASLSAILLCLFGWPFILSYLSFQ